MLSVSGADPHFISGPTILHHIFMVFQHMGVAATLALMMGAIAEWTTFRAMPRSVSLCSVMISCPVACRLRGGGRLGKKRSGLR